MVDSIIGDPLLLDHIDCFLGCDMLYNHAKQSDADNMLTDLVQPWSKFAFREMNNTLTKV